MDESGVSGMDSGEGRRGVGRRGGEGIEWMVVSQVRLSMLVIRGGLEIPAAALLFRSSGPQVAVVGQDGRVQFHPVTIARDEGNKVEIGSGLSVGDGSRSISAPDSQR